MWRAVAHREQKYSTNFNPVAFLHFLKRVRLQVKIILVILSAPPPRAEMVNYGTSAFVITDARMEIVAPFYHGQPDKPKGN